MCEHPPSWSSALEGTRMFWNPGPEMPQIPRGWGLSQTLQAQGTELRPRGVQMLPPWHQPGMAGLPCV